MVIRIAIGMGGNLGDRRTRLEEAARALFDLAAPGSFRLASLYETAPLGPPQPDYLNSAASFLTELSLEALLDAVLAIEARAGRVRPPIGGPRWGPRTLDLDLLFALAPDGAPIQYHSARLEVPHPELFRRAFALAPLLDVLPELLETQGPLLDALGGPPPRVAQARVRGRGYKGWTASARVR